MRVVRVVHLTQSRDEFENFPSRVRMIFIFTLENNKMVKTSM